MRKLEIERHVFSLMGRTGKSILHELKSSMPSLDLFVRESIQNSLDAKKKDERKIKLDFICNSFDNNEFSKYFEGIEQKLLKIESNEFIAVCDSNTTGLTGNVNLKDFDGNWGKFLKLVRNIGISDKEMGSGGSWGYGKTIYYNLGKGLVLYYSRVKENNSFSDRLMACLVENQEKKDGLLYDSNEKNNTGIAWWGENSSDGLLPITNSEHIKEILDVFGIEKYDDDKTGTIIIVPYINSEKLLDETTELDSTDEKCPYWCKSISSYLKVSIQRWYPTKYCNNHDGFDLFINNEPVLSNSFLPIYNIIQDFYNYSKKISGIKFTPQKKEINLKNIFSNTQNAGVLYYDIYDKENLEREVFIDSFTQINNQLNNDNHNVIITFCRKPGMMLRYDINDSWANGIPSPGSDKLFIGLFIPNSNNVIRMGNYPDLPLEEYLRQSEQAIHDNWMDPKTYEYIDGTKVDISKLSIVKKIQNNIKNKMVIKTDKDEIVSGVSSELSNLLTKLFLPQQGFGKKPVSIPKNPNTQSGTRVLKTRLVIGDTLYKDSCLCECKVLLAKGQNKFDIDFLVNTENKKYTIDKWVEQGLDIPIDIQKIKIKNIFCNNVEIDDNSSIIIEKKYINNSCYGLEFNVTDSKITSFILILQYVVINKNIESILALKVGD